MDSILPMIAAGACGVALLYLVVTRTMRRRKEDSAIASRMATPQPAAGMPAMKKAA